MRNGSCPSCNQPVRLPDMAPSTRVRCPLCRAEHTARDFLPELPPTVEIVDPSSEDEAPEPTESDSVAQTTGLDWSLAATGAPNTAASLDEGAALDGPWASSTSPPIDQMQRLPSPSEMAPLIVGSGKHAVRRRHFSVWGFLKVVIGAAVGAVLAQLILWWLPAPYRSDPLHLAPRLPPQWHWVLPADFPLLPENSSPEPMVTPEPPESSHVPPPESGVVFVNDPPETVTRTTVAPVPSSGHQVLKPRHQEEFSGVELEAAVRDTQAATARMTMASGARRQAARAEWSRSLDLLAYRLAFADPDDPLARRQRSAVSALVNSIWAQPAWRLGFETHLRNQASKWESATATSPPYEGCWVGGTVAEVTECVGSWRVMIQSGWMSQPLAVHIPVDPSRTGTGLGNAQSVGLPAVRAGDTIVVAGLRVVDPQRDLIGYVSPEGESSALGVIWSALWVNVAEGPPASDVH